MVETARTDAVREQGRQVASTASRETGRVVDEAKEQAAEVGREVAAQTQQVLHRTKDQLVQQSEAQAQSAARSLRRLSEQARALSEGRPDAAGALTDYVQQATSKLEGLADRLEQRGAQGLVTDVQRFGREHPGTFLLGAVTAGFVVGRMARSMSGTQGRSRPQASSPTMRGAIDDGPPPIPIAPYTIAGGA